MERRLWIPEKGKVNLPGFWTPGKRKRQEAPRRRPSRREIRAVLNAHHRVRLDGTPFTQPSLATRKAIRRRRNAAARLARRTHA